MRSRLVVPLIHVLDHLSSMELLVITLCAVSLATVVVLFIWSHKLGDTKSSNPKKRLPPGPWTLPIIGSIHHVVGGFGETNMAPFMQFRVILVIE